MWLTPLENSAKSKGSRLGVDYYSNSYACIWLSDSVIVLVESSNDVEMTVGYVIDFEQALEARPHYPLYVELRNAWLSCRERHC